MRDIILSESLALYRSKDGRIKLEVRLREETLWLTQKDMAALFSTDRTVIGRHIRNILKSGELESESNVQKMHIAGSDRPVSFYNLDMIISVGYRVNSRRGTDFRIWATRTLREHIVKGFTLNESRLKEEVARLRDLRAAVDLMGRVLADRKVSGAEATGLLKVISDYSLALRILDEYDHQSLRLAATTTTARFEITYEGAIMAVATMRETMGPAASDLFGREKDKSLRGSIGAIYQTFGGRDLYPSVEEKAAHLLYFVVKNHSFVDGNKRIAAFLFLWFLDGNRILYRKNGTKRLADNALVALTLLIAESKPSEKETICRVIVNLINRENS